MFVPYLKPSKNRLSMFSQTFKAAQVVAFIFISVAATAQPYNQPNERSDVQITAEPVRPAHIQINVQQQEISNLKFNVTVVNPFAKSATIMVCKGRDILYAEDGVKGQYKTIFNLNELEDGNYKIVVISGKESITKDINIRTTTTTDREVVVN
jgi:hypothetical protein